MDLQSMEHKVERVGRLNWECSVPIKRIVYVFAGFTKRSAIRKAAKYFNTVD